MYYAQSVEGSITQFKEYQEMVLKFTNMPIEERSIPGEQVKSKAKDALNIVKKYFDDKTKTVWIQRGKCNLRYISEEEVKYLLGVWNSWLGTF